MTNENKKITSEQKICVSQELTETVCDKRCKICNSEHLKAIHDLKKAGYRHLEIVDIVKEKYGFEISDASLSRHFRNYQKRKAFISAQLIHDDLIEEVTKQATHTKQLVALIDQAFKMIKARLDAGTLVFDVADLDKLMKLRYQILSGQDTDENDVMAIFQKASDKYGLNLQQGILFKPPTLRRAEQ